MERGKWLNRMGGALCAVVMLCLVQGMLYTSRETVSVSSTKEETKKTAYLTFDDGPSVLTAEYLKILKEEGVRATFFLIGEQIDGELADVAKQEIADGHEVGMHTYCHVADTIYSSAESYCMDLRKTKQCIQEKLNIEPKLFRFPWGSANAYIRSYKENVIAEMKAEKLDYADWNVSGEDSVGYPTADTILANIKKDYGKYDEPVILLHDSASCKATLAALPAIIRELKDAGYSFATLSEKKGSSHFEDLY